MMSERITRKTKAFPVRMSVNDGPEFEALATRDERQQLGGKPEGTPRRIVRKDSVTKIWPQALGGPRQITEPREEREMDLYRPMEEEERELIARMERDSRDAPVGTESIFVRIQSAEGAKVFWGTAIAGSAEMEVDHGSLPTEPFVKSLSIRWVTPDQDALLAAKKEFDAEDMS